MRKPFIAGNWKMYKTAGEAIAVATILASELSAEKNKKIMIAPPFTALHAVRDVLEGTTIILGAQNAAAEIEGAHTGEISPRMLADAGVSIIILGHSERRHVYGETDALINRKVRLALAEGFEVILCVGETLEERQKGVTEKLVASQTSGGLTGVSEKDLGRVTIAYEPVWAIGTGQERNSAGCGRSACLHPRPSCEVVRRESGPGHDNPVWRLGEAGQYQGPDEDGKHRRSACGRGFPEAGNLPSHRAL